MKILTYILLIVAMSIPINHSTAISSDRDNVKYEVNIVVRYNAVSIEEASKIVADAIERHKTACKTDVKLKKLEDNLVFSSGSDYILRWNGGSVDGVFDTQVLSNDIAK